MAGGAGRLIGVRRAGSPSLELLRQPPARSLHHQNVPRFPRSLGWPAGRKLCSDFQFYPLVGFQTWVFYRLFLVLGEEKNKKKPGGAHKDTRRSSSELKGLWHHLTVHLSNPNGEERPFPYPERSDWSGGVGHTEQYPPPAAVPRRAPSSSRKAAARAEGDFSSREM